MAYMARHAALRLDPRGFFPQVRTVVAVALNYYAPHPVVAEAGPPNPAPGGGGPPQRARISRYAWGRDYHGVLRKLLRRFLGGIQELVPGVSGRYAVDTAPVMDKMWAVAAGLGWQGRHTNVILPRLGSWVFLGTLWLDLELPADPPVPDRCGRCRRCLEACPTGALPRPYVLDARRCIAYWTIEHRGPFGPATPRWRDWLFGCDACQEVCPWNKFQRTTPNADFHPRPETVGLRLETWASLDEDLYRRVTRSSPLKRAGREGLRRNARWLLGGTHAEGGEDAAGS
jgi:epoxyqueuosine reductase